MAQIRYFTCSNAELNNVQNVLQASTTVAALRSSVLSAANEATAWTWNAIGSLTVSPRSDAVKTLFREAFSVCPEVVPTWRPARASWPDFGGLVAIRLTRAAAIINSGWIRYFCWGSAAHCPECGASPPTYFACSSYRGRYHICFGPAFWRAVSAGDRTTMAATLLHEALHIYFNRTVSHTGWTGNAFCYERFVGRFNGLALDAATTAGCPATAAALGVACP